MSFLRRVQSDFGVVYDSISSSISFAPSTEEELSATIESSLVLSPSNVQNDVEVPCLASASYGTSSAGSTKIKSQDDTSRKRVTAGQRQKIRQKQQMRKRILMGSSDQSRYQMSHAAVVSKQEEQRRLRAELDRKLKKVSASELVEQLQAARNIKGIPQTIIMENRNDIEDDSDLISIISSLSNNMHMNMNMNRATRQNAFGRDKTRIVKSQPRANKAKTSRTLRRMPPLPPIGNSDPFKAQGLEVVMTIDDRPLHGLYSGSLDSHGRPSGMGVVKFENNDLYIGDFWDGMLHGQGTFLFDEGSDGLGGGVLTGEFEYNKIVI